MSATDWIFKKAAGTLHPAQVENTLERLVEAWPAEAPPLQELVENLPLGEAALLRLISVSSICALRLVRLPEILLGLSRPEISTGRRPGQPMAGGLQCIAQGSAFSGNFQALRFWK